MLCVSDLGKPSHTYLCCSCTRALTSASHVSEVTQIASEFTSPPVVPMDPPALCKFSFATQVASPALTVTSVPFACPKSRRQESNHRGDGGPKCRNQEFRELPPGLP